MAVLFQLAKLSSDTTLNTALLIAAQSIMSASVIPEKRRLGTTIFTGTSRMHQWWNLEADRIARPNPVKLAYIDFKNDIDPETFTTELLGSYMLYDMFITHYDVEIPVLEYDDTDSVLTDIYACALYSVAVLEEIPLYTMYLSVFFSLMQLKELEVVKPNFKPTTGIRMSPAFRF